MTPEQIELVQTSFKKVVPIAGAAADLFYGRLFEIAPEVRSMFPDDLSEQKKKLMAMLGTAVGNLHQLDRLAMHATLEGFARQYSDLAVEPGGAFWLATSDGLYRYALPQWRKPPATQRAARKRCGRRSRQARSGSGNDRRSD